MSERGYVYRIPNANSSRLKQVITDIVGKEGWTFGGAILWDFDPDKEQANLQPITSIGTGDINVTGDFGQAFSQQAEIRWKRRDQDSYDVLVLSEQEADITGAIQIGESWNVQTNNNLQMMYTGETQGHIRCKTYHTTNGVVQFVRYTEVHS